APPPTHSLLSFPPRRSSDLAGALVGVLDITAACINARVIAGFPPVHVLQSVAGGLLGRGTYNGGFATAALGLAMHFTMALTVARSEEHTSELQSRFDLVCRL